MLRLFLAAIFLVAVTECDPYTYEGQSEYGNIDALKKEILEDIIKAGQHDIFEKQKKNTRNQSHTDIHQDIHPPKKYYPPSEPYYPPSKTYYSEPKVTYPSPKPEYSSNSNREYQATFQTSLPSLDEFTFNPIGGDYRIIERGQRNTASYRIFISNNKGEIVSPWHDIPLFFDQTAHIFHAVVEIPRWINAKFEISKKEKFNPIYQQITSDNKLRYNWNVLPFHGYIWNYCSLPQTWLAPNVNVEKLGYPGDDDLLDVVEIGSKIHSRGSVIRVKVLGALGFVDGGRLQGEPKIIAIDVTDPIAWKLNDINDVETHLVGLLNAIKEWFKYYKVPTGVPVNFFTNNGQYYDKAATLEIINKHHSLWNNLIKGVTPNPTANGLLHTSWIAGSSNLRTISEAGKIVTLETKEFSPLVAPIDQAEYEKVGYVNKN